MAFSATSFALVGGAAGNSSFLYRTADDLNTVLGTGYFNGAAAYVNVGDGISITVETGGTPFHFEARVTANTGTVVTVKPAGYLIRRSLTLAVTAVANTDFTVSMPPGTFLRATSLTTTAFTGNTVTMQLGTAAGGTQIVAAASIKAAGVVSHTLVGSGLAFAGGTLHARIAQTATETAVGAGKLVVEMLVD